MRLPTSTISDADRGLGDEEVRELTEISPPVLAAIGAAGLAIIVSLMVFIGWPAIMVRDGMLIERRPIMRKTEMRVADITGVELHIEDPNNPRLIFYNTEGEEIVIDAEYTKEEIEVALNRVRSARPDLAIPEVPKPAH